MMVLDRCVKWVLWLESSDWEVYQDKMQSSSTSRQDAVLSNEYASVLDLKPGLQSLDHLTFTQFSSLLKNRKPGFY
jgi:hypothetical protein